MFTVKNEKTYIKAVLLLIAIFTFAIDVFSILKYGNYFLLGNFEKMNNDDVRYIRTAQVLLQKGMLVDIDVNTPTVAEMPGHAFLLAGFFKVFGTENGITAFRIFQAILQVLCGFLIFFIGREIYNSLIGIFACVIHALYVPEISNVGLILTEIVFKFLLLLLIYVSIYAIKTKNMKYYIWGSIIWGVTCLFRPTIALYPMVVLVLWLLYRYSFKEMLKYAVTAVLIFCTILSPWWIRNYLTFGRFIPLTLGSGNPFLQGTYINYDQTKDFTYYTANKDPIKTDQIEMETGKYRLKTYFKKYPLEYIYWYTIGKTWHLWRYPFYWKQIFEIKFIPVWKYHQFILRAGVLGMLLAFMSFRNRKYDSAFAVLPIIYFTLIHLPYFTFSRYAYPVMGLMIILAANGALNILKVGREYLLMLQKCIYQQQYSYMHIW